ncbi:MAG: EAL domain-containing protein [Betaproteobacteria bacterium]|nr:EAL domain-containing protein [Betaproteobacteria bacterium]
MSLLRQLWITVIVASLIALLGSIGVSLYTARSYLEQQLLAQGSDAAAALALSMSQHPSDDTTVELMVTALFDSGHFELVRYMDQAGKIVIERRSDAPPSAAPAWFAHLANLSARPGTAFVSHGWSQSGSVTVVAHKRFAYDALWRGTLQLLGLMIVLAVLWGLAMNFVMRWLRRPIDQMVQQANAIGARRFITVEEPRVIELRVAVRALNLMVEQVRTMFSEQANRIEELRTEANRDALTQLPNRGFFVGRLRDELGDESAAPNGALALVRLANLGQINRHLGRERTDALIKATADILCHAAAEESDHFIARLNGSDFAWLMPGAEPEWVRRHAAAIARALEALRQQGQAEDSPVGFVGFTLFTRGDELGSVLSCADMALMRAERGEEPEPVTSAHGAPLAARSQNEWRALLSGAIRNRSFALATFPVAHIDGSIWHEEAMMRMRAPDDGAPWTAGQFMPAADRLGMTADLDLLAIELAMQRLAHSDASIAVNLSPISLLDLKFREGVQKLLATAPAAAGRLWVEVSEYGLDQGLSGLAAIAPILSRYGCKLGIEHFGRHFSAIPRLYAQRVDYLKIDGSFVAGIEENAGNQRLIKAIVDVAGGLDIVVLAERVHNEAEWETLNELGVAGLTGPVVTERLRKP